MFCRYRILLYALMIGISLNSNADKPERSSGHEQVPGWMTNGLNSLEYGFLIEVEGFAAKSGGRTESDMVLATVAFDLEAAMTDWLSGHIGLLWEEDSRETDNIDEAYIALGASEEIPYYFVVGRYYQPVGNFESIFISDPLPLELIEMNTESAMVGYQHDHFVVNAGAFNGDVKEGIAEGDGGDDTISDFFASFSVSPCEAVTFGAYWLSDLMEGYNQVAIGELIATQPGYEKVDAAGAFINAVFGPVSLNVEYVSALDSYEVSGGSYAPSALHLEGSVQVCEKVAVGLQYGASDDLYAGFGGPVLGFGDKLPGETAGIVVAYYFEEYASVALEYLHVEELDDNKSGDVVTVQLALAF